MDTAWGVIPLKHFFVDGMENADGVEVSKNEIRYVLKTIIDNEDKTHPLTDDEIVDILKNKGYNIADGGLNGNTYAGKSQDEMNELQEKRLKKIKGRKHTEESKNKMSKSHKARNKGKKIICIETNITFINSEDVIEKMFNGQGTSSNIRCNCRGITKSAYGYHFKYIE